MVRVALLVTVLAALCYTSQAIPVQVENVEDTQALPYGFLDEMREKFEKVRDEIKGAFEKLPEKLQNVKDKVNENLKKFEKWYQDHKISYEEFSKYLEELVQKATESYDKLLEEANQKSQDLFKGISSEELKKKLKEILEKLKGNNETYGMSVWEELMKKVKEQVNQLKEEADTLKQSGQELVEKLKRQLEGQIEYLKGKLGELTGEAKKKYDEIIKKLEEKLEELKKRLQGLDNGQQVQQASLVTSYGFIDEILNETKHIISDAMRLSKNAANHALDIAQKGTKIPGQLLDRLFL